MITAKVKIVIGGRSQLKISAPHLGQPLGQLNPIFPRQLSLQRAVWEIEVLFPRAFIVRVRSQEICM